MGVYFSLRTDMKNVQKRYHSIFAVQLRFFRVNRTSVARDLKQLHHDQCGLFSFRDDSGVCAATGINDRNLVIGGFNNLTKVNS